jgi:hypothetical protein
MSGKQLAISHNFKDLDCCDLDFAISLRLALRDRHNLIIFCSSIKRMNYDLHNQQTPQPPAPDKGRFFTFGLRQDKEGTKNSRQGR